MSWWTGLERNTRAGSAGAVSEEAVVVHLKLSEAQGLEEERNSIHRMSDLLNDAILTKGVGEFDGDQFGGGEFVLYMYGPDADQLFAAIYPLLKGWDSLRGGYAIRRYGPPGSRSEKVDF
jgi:hypothetical protein